MKDMPTPNAAAEGSDADQDINLMDMLTALGEEKWRVLLMTLLAGLIGLAVALIIKPTFTAKTTLLPPQQSGSSSGLSATLGALAAGLGGGGIKTPEDLYVALLRADTVSNNLIAQFKLTERYETENMVDTRKRLVNAVRIVGDKKSSIITIEVDDDDPVFAAQLANAYSVELRKLLTRVAVSEAQQRRLYFQLQMDKAKADLTKAELDVKQAQDKSGLLSLDSNTQAAIAAAAQIRGQIVAREVQLQATRPYAGPENPDLKRLLSELTSLRNQLNKMESGNDALKDDNPADRKILSDALASVRSYRELKFQESIYAAMLQQLTIASADEAKEAPLVQQIDIALPPDKKSKPAKSFIVLVSTVAGGFLGLLWAFIRRTSGKTQRDSASAVQWAAMRQAWSLRKAVPRT